ncbi:MAG: DUF4406 domain-containing protein [Prevotella sp.]|nr:DUF4406 domain-containing protein [Prevotella sp.]
MRVYISGKIGEDVISEATLDKFSKVELQLKQQGHTVFNPTKSGLGCVADKRVKNARKQGDSTTWYNEILKLDIAKLSFCDAIVMLPDWASSPGALAELAFAAAVGIKTYLWSEVHESICYCHPTVIIRSML